MIFEYIYNYNLKFKLLKYNKLLQKKCDLNLYEYQKYYRLKLKFLTFDELFKNKKELVEKNNLNESTFNSIIKTYIYEYINNYLKNNSENCFEFVEIESKNNLEYFTIAENLCENLNIKLNISNNLKENQIKLYQQIIQNIISSSKRILISLVNNKSKIKNGGNEEIINLNSILEKMDIYHCKRLCLNNINYLDINFKLFSNLIELSFIGNFTKKEFEIINSMNSLTYLSLKDNTIQDKFTLTLNNLIYLSLENCESTFIIKSKKIVENLIYFKIDSCDVIFDFLKKNEKIAFPYLQYLFFNEDIIDFNNSKNIKKIKENKIELHQNTINYYINLFENCKEIQDVNLDIYHIKRIEENLFNKFLNIFSQLNFKSICISSSFNESILKQLFENSNISKSCESLKCYIEDPNFIDFFFTNCINLKNININIEKKIPKFRINTVKNETINYLNDKLIKQYKLFYKDNNYVIINENYKININSIQINNSCFSILKNYFYCQNFTTLITLKLINIPINTETLPLFNKNCQINFFNLKNLTIRIMSYIETYYILEFKKKTLFQMCKNNLQNPFDINTNLIEKKAIINFSNNLHQVPNLENLVLNFMIPDINKDFIKDFINKILDLKYLDNLDFSITQTHEEIILKTNQLCNIFPKLKNNQRLLKKNFKIVY